MGILDNTAADIAAQLIKHQQIVTFHSIRSGIEAIFDKAYLIEPRLTGCVAGWKGNSTATNALGINKKYELNIQYDDYVPDDFQDVVLDHGTWRPLDILEKGEHLPPFVRVITKDEAGLMKRLEEDIPKLEDAYYGPLFIKTQTRHRSGEYICVIIHFETLVNQQQYETWQKMAQRQAAQISQCELGGKTPPPFMRAFLALSYLQQNCRYDEETAALINSDPNAKADRPHVLYPYGPICRGEGVCEGIAGAFKLFMEQGGIECHCLKGRADGENHMWNVIQLDGMYYHVDPTAGITGSGVYVGGFLKTDKEMTKSNYLWNPDHCPSCMGRRYSYYTVEEYIEDNGPELLSGSIDPKYLMPENILI